MKRRAPAPQGPWHGESVVTCELTAESIGPGAETPVGVLESVGQCPFLESCVCGGAFKAFCNRLTHFC